MSPQLEQVIQTIQQLPASEQEKILEWLEERKAAIKAEISATDKLDRQVLEQLLAKGLLGEIAEPMTDEEDDEFEAIKIAGEPLSEMIIGERR